MRRTKEDAAATREQLLDAALRVFARKGYAATRLEDVAAEAGVTRGAVYWHFAGKPELYTSLVGERMAKVAERYRAGAAAPGRRARGAGRGGGGACGPGGGEGSPLGALRSLLVGALEPLVDDADYRALVEVMWLKTELVPELEAGFRQKVAAVRELVDVAAGLVERGVAAGEVAAGVEPRAAALAAVGLLNGLTALYLTAPAVAGGKASLRGAVDVFVRGLRA